MTSSWLLVIGLFIGASWIADRRARSDTSLGMQYAGLTLYVVIEAVTFLPLLHVAAYHSGPSVIPVAALLTGLLFVGLTLVAMTTRADSTSSCAVSSSSAASWHSG